MSKKQIIREQQIAIQSLEADYAEVVDQRDAYAAELKADDRAKAVRDAAKREAEIQERVDGIKAGLIPVEELRRAFDGLEIDAEGTAFVTYRFDKHADRPQKALSDVLTAKPKWSVDNEIKAFASGGYTSVPFWGVTNVS